MGSLMLTMKGAAAALTLLLSVLSSFSLIHCSQSLQWQQATYGNIPSNALRVLSRNKTPHYPCRVSASSQTGGHSYGVLSGAGERACKYADTNQQEILSSSSFDILVGDQSKVRLKYYRGEPYLVILTPEHSQTATLVRGSTLMVSVMRNLELSFLQREESSWSIPTLLIKFQFVVLLD